MNLFSPASGRPDAAKVAEVKRWVAEALRLEEGAVVLVSELRCSEPGCPPLETIIAILRESGQRTQTRIHKSIADLSRDEVIARIG